ncbi:cellulose biosynthesis protein BcsG [Pseudoalteromonas arctica]
MTLSYNTINLHDGDQLVGRGRMNCLQNYPTRQQQLFNLLWRMNPMSQ